MLRVSTPIDVSAVQRVLDISVFPAHVGPTNMKPCRTIDVCKKETEREGQTEDKDRSEDEDVGEAG